MITLETTQNVPLMQTEDGTIHVTGSRVSLEAVVYQYQIENSAETHHRQHDLAQCAQYGREYQPSSTPNASA